MLREVIEINHRECGSGMSGLDPDFQCLLIEGHRFLKMADADIDIPQGVHRGAEIELARDVRGIQVQQRHRDIALARGELLQLSHLQSVHRNRGQYSDIHLLCMQGHAIARPLHQDLVNQIERVLAGLACIRIATERLQSLAVAPAGFGVQGCGVNIRQILGAQRGQDMHGLLLVQRALGRIILGGQSVAVDHQDLGISHLQFR